MPCGKPRGASARLTPNIEEIVAGAVELLRGVPARNKSVAVDLPDGMVIDANGLVPFPGGGPGGCPPDPRQVQLCRWFLTDCCVRTKTVRRKHTSYHYKHCVERWAEERLGRHTYIANGSVIQAAWELGFTLKPASQPNAWLNLSLRTRGVE